MGSWCYSAFDDADGKQAMEGGTALDEENQREHRDCTGIGRHLKEHANNLPPMPISAS